MKTVKEELDFCNEFTFYEQNNFESVIEIKRVRDFVVAVSSKCIFISGHKGNIVLGVIDDLS